MNPSEEAVKRQENAGAKMGLLAYERLQLSRRVESCQKRIAEIDETLSRLEAGMEESDRARRDFDTYLALQEGAVTGDQLKDAIETGRSLDAPLAAVASVPPEESEAKDG